MKRVTSMNFSVQKEIALEQARMRMTSVTANRPDNTTRVTNLFWQRSSMVK